MVRRKSQTQILAEWFVTVILERQLDFRFDRQHLKAAKELINPSKAENVQPLDIEVVQICLTELKAGRWDFDPIRLTSLHAVTWGKPPFYERALGLLAQVPPPYEITAYDQWVLKYGRLSQKIGAWSGVYVGYENPLELPFRLTPELVRVALMA